MKFSLKLKAWLSSPGCTSMPQEENVYNGNQIPEAAKYSDY